MSQYKYSDAYQSIKAPIRLKEKVLNNKPSRKAFNYKGLISVAACVIIMASMFPAYVGLTEPSVSVSSAMPMAARYIGTQIPLELNLERRSRITVSHGTLEGYNGERTKGNIALIWNINTEEYEDCTLEVQDNLKTTVYSLSYNENNGSWSIIKN